jgi:hypothetical protein
MWIWISWVQHVLMSSGKPGLASNRWNDARLIANHYFLFNAALEM